jgi:AcrR family transcriptional regulator
VFATSGVEAPMREIAERAGVGVGTIYRNFPQRSDLISAVFRSEVDACADAADTLLETYSGGEALDHWMQRYVDFIVAKRGLAAALHSGDPAFEALPAYFDARFEPALQKLLNAAVGDEEIRPDANPYDLLRAVASLCMPSSDGNPAPARRLVALLVDGLRYRAGSARDS